MAIKRATEFSFMNPALINRQTNVDEFNEILASKSDFRLVHAVDGHLQSFVHGQCEIG